MAAQAVGSSSIPQSTVGLCPEWVAARVAHNEHLKQLLNAVFTDPGTGRIKSRNGVFADAVSGETRSVMVISRLDIYGLDALPETVRLLAQQIAARNGEVAIHFGTMCGISTKLGVVGDLATKNFELVAVRALPRPSPCIDLTQEMLLEYLAELDAVHDSLREHAVPGVALPMSRFLSQSEDSTTQIVSTVPGPTRPIEVMPLMLGSLGDYRASQTFTEKGLLALSQPVLATLQTLHEHDIVHGNLHEGNVLVTSDGKLLLSGLSTYPLVKLCTNISTDGNSKNMRWSVYIPGERLAPEMNLSFVEDLSHKDVAAIKVFLDISTIPTGFTPASDVWQLGAFLFKLATGTELYDAGVPSKWKCRAERYPALRNCPASMWFYQLMESKVLPTVIKGRSALTRFVAGLTRWEVSKRYSVKFAALLLKMLVLYKEQTAEVAAAWAARAAEASEASA